MHQWPSSLRSRLTLWYTALLAVPLIAFALLCYFVFAHALLGRTDRFIGDALSAFARELVAGAPRARHRCPRARDPLLPELHRGERARRSARLLRGGPVR